MVVDLAIVVFCTVAIPTVMCDGPRTADETQCHDLTITCLLHLLLMTRSGKLTAGKTKLDTENKYSYSCHKEEYNCILFHLNPCLFTMTRHLLLLINLEKTNEM